jgi:phosphoribosylamine--glycine ligase
MDGVEIAVGASFNGKDFVYPINVNFEHKRLFNKGLGPLTWEMGTLLFHSSKNALFEKTLLKMKEKLAEVSFVGNIDINCIVNKKGIFPLEFTCRFAFPTTQLMWEGEKGKVGQYFLKLARSEIQGRTQIKGFTTGALICVPPFPYADKNEMEKYKGAMIIFDGKMDGVHLVDAIRRKGKFLVNGFAPLIICARGKSVEEAKKKLYKRIKGIHIENMYYRTDIGDFLEEDSKLLKEWGYI